MKNKVSGWITGGLLAVAVLGVSLSNSAIASAAPAATASMGMQQEKSTNSDVVMAQETQKSCCEAKPKAEGSSGTGMMQSEEMQKQCGEMMKNRVDDTKKEPVVSATSEQDHNAHRQI